MCSLGLEQHTYYLLTAKNTYIFKKDSGSKQRSY